MFILYILGFIIAGILFTILIDKFIGGGKSPTPHPIDIQQNTLNQLKSILNTHGDISLSQAITLLNPRATLTTPTPTPPPTLTPTKPSLNASLQNWYQLNTISLLLYLGALLILVSAYVFVQFQWEAYTGLTKATLLSVLGLSFFSFGWWFKNLPKVKLAGITFIGLSALLLPVIGYGWHTFVFASLGIPLWQVWGLFSILSLLIYFILAIWLDHSFYGYCASLAGISSFLSLTHSTTPSIDIYLFTSLTTGLFLLIASHLISYLQPKFANTLSKPWWQVANLLVPITFTFGLTYSIAQSQLYTLTSILAISLTIIFYLINYLIKNDSWLFIIVQLLGLFAVWITTGTITPNTGTILVVSQIYIIASLLSSYIWQHYDQKDQSQTISIISLAGACVIVPISHLLFLNSFAISPSQLTLIALLAILANLIFSHHKRTSYNLGLISPLIYYAIAQIGQSLPFVETYLPQLITTILVSLSIISYALSQTHYSRQSIKEGLYLLTSVSLLISFFTATQTQIPYLFFTLSLSAIILHFSRQTKEALYLYAAHACLHWSLYILTIPILNINQQYLPFIFAFFSILIYTIGSTLPAISAKNWQYSGLATAIAIPYYLYFGYQISQFNSLIAAYLGVTLFLIHAIKSKTDNIWYLSLLTLLITFLWNLSYLSINQVLAYSIPLGLYFLGLGTHRRYRQDPNQAIQLESLGIVILSLVPIVRSFTTDPIMYSLVLVLLSLVFLAAGITAHLKHYIWAGIVCLVFAVIPHTYQYILLIPRWLLIGILGFIFLIGAIYLLSHRDPKTSQN